VINVLITEIIKLRRSKMLILALLISFIPAPIKFIQQVLGKVKTNVTWEWFLSAHQEIMVFGMLTAIILVSCFIFGMEYQYNTVSSAFTASVSRTEIFIGKVITLLFVISALFIISALSHLLFGCFTVKEGLKLTFLLKYLKVVLFFILGYFSLTSLMAFINIIVRKYAVSAALILGYFMLVFPMHLKNNLFINPFMIPTVIASKILGSSNYIFSDYYKDVSVSYTGITLFLSAIFIFFLIAGMTYYKKRDAL